MSEEHTNESRRSFLKKSTAFSIVPAQLVRGQGPARLKAGLVGCGGRGTGAAIDLLTGTENVELVAMADLFEDKLEQSLGRLRDPKTAGRHAGINGKTAQELAASIGPRI
jgi:hypothetical protein